MSSYFELERRLSRFRTHKRSRGARPSAGSIRPAPPRPSVGGAAKPGKSKAVWQAVRAFTSPVSYRVPGIVPPERQPTSMTCWATVTTMMVEWLENRSMSIGTAVGNVGSAWLAKFTANQGLASSEKAGFLAAAGLVAEPPMCYSIEGWLQLLRTYGPLWATTDEDPSANFAIHARIIVGIEGDGTPEGTTLRIVDPATATEYSETVTVFSQKFESEALDPKPPLRIQVVHWPANAQSSGGGITQTQSYRSMSFPRRVTRSLEDGGAADAGTIPAPTPAVAGSLAWGARVAPDFRSRLRQISTVLSCNPDHLMAAMAFETGETFSPSIRNQASGATGLIQFMPSTARSLGTTTDDLAAMSAVQQLDYVERYFRGSANRLNSLEDVYMAILWPRAVGQTNSYVLFSQPSRAYELNQGLDADRDGSVTKMEAASPVQRKLTKGLLPQNVA